MKKMKKRKIHKILVRTSLTIWFTYSNAKQCSRISQQSNFAYTKRASKPKNLIKKVSKSNTEFQPQF